MKKFFLMAALMAATTLGLNAQTVDSKDYDCGDDVTLTAAEKEHYHFVNWTNTVGGAVVSTEKSFDISAIAADYDLTANFAINQTKLTVTSGLGGAITVPDPNVYESGKMVDYNESITITASADNCYQFAGWEATGITLTDAQKMSLTLTFNMPDLYPSGEVILNATWKKIKYNVKVRANDDAMGTASQAKK